MSRFLLVATTSIALVSLALVMFLYLLHGATTALPMAVLFIALDVIFVWLLSRAVRAPTG